MILIFGSRSLYKEQLEYWGNTPTFTNFFLSTVRDWELTTEVEIGEAFAGIITEEPDGTVEAHGFWDGISQGTYGDLRILIDRKIPVKWIYLPPNLAELAAAGSLCACLILEMQEEAQP